MEPNNEQLIRMYRTMLLIRRFEEKVHELFREGAIRGTAHTYIGQEAVAVGVCAALDPEDFISSTHRGHGHSIAKGADLRLTMAELMGKETGYCRGKGGSMHIANRSQGNLGAMAIVGGSIPIGTGAALAAKQRRSGQVSVVFFGDGAANEGTFHESCNLAAIWKLPVIYVNENNQYALSVPFKYHSSVPDISIRAQGYGFPGVAVDGNDVLEVYEATQQAVTRAREGQGPSLIVCSTYRLMSHSAFASTDLRPREEVEEAMRRDPIPRLRRLLLGERDVVAAELEGVEAAVADEVGEAVEFARSSSEPPLSAAYEDVYA